MLIGCSGPSSSPETSGWNISTSHSEVALGGNPTGSFDLDTDGPWSAVTSASWLEVSPTQGVGPVKVTVTAHREDLAPDTHSADVTITSGNARTVVAVTSRFPTIDIYSAETRSLRIQAGSSTVTRVAWSDSGDHHPTDLIVTLPSLKTNEEKAPAGDVLAAVARDHRAQVVRSVFTDARTIATLRVADDLAYVAQRIREDPRVEGVSPSVRMDLLESDPLTNDQAWHYQAINLDRAWSTTTGSSDVTVAIIDSGFDLLHEDLADNMQPGYDFGDHDAVAHAGTLACGDHGTHVAGTVGAASNGLGGTGVSPVVSIFPLKIGAYNASTGACDIWSATLVDALYHAAGAEVSGVPPLDEPVDVINMSLGGPSYNTALHEAVQFASDRGVTLVAASGNGGDSDVMFPAAHPEVIAIGATNSQSERATYSSYGPELDLMAPGGEGFIHAVVSTRWSDTGDAYGNMQGTSMATPHVTGVVALMKGVRTDLSPATVQHLLQSSARDIGAEGWDDLTGFGIVDAEAAVKAAEAHVSNDDSTFRLHARNEDGSWRLIAESAGGSALQYLQADFTTYLAEVGLDADGDGVLGEPGERYGSESFGLSSDHGDRGVTVEMTVQ